MSAIARYTITLTLDRAIRPDCWDDDPADLIPSFTDATARRELEREVLRAMKKLDGDADCEVMTVEVLSEEKVS